MWLAHDTRPSALTLMQAAQAGIACLQAKGVNYGPLTTPQLHWLVSAGLLLASVGLCATS